MHTSKVVSNSQLSWNFYTFINTLTSITADKFYSNIKTKWSIYADKWFTRSRYIVIYVFTNVWYNETIIKLRLLVGYARGSWGHNFFMITRIERIVNVWNVIFPVVVPATIMVHWWRIKLVIIMQETIRRNLFLNRRMQNNSRKNCWKWRNCRSINCIF